MTLIRFFLFFILFWVITKAVRYLIQAFSTPLNEDKKQRVDDNPKKKYEINNKDIIEAEFEEIKETSADNSK